MHTNTYTVRLAAALLLLSPVLGLSQTISDNFTGSASSYSWTPRCRGACMTAGAMAPARCPPVYAPAVSRPCVSPLATTTATSAARPSRAASWVPDCRMPWAVARCVSRTAMATTTRTAALILELHVPEQRAACRSTSSRPTPTPTATPGGAIDSDGADGGKISSDRPHLIGVLQCRRRHLDAL